MAWSKGRGLVAGAAVACLCAAAASATLLLRTDDGTHEVTSSQAASPKAGAEPAASLPHQPTALAVQGIPNDQQLLQTKKLTGVHGEEVTIQWYGTPSFGPRYTTNLTVGADAAKDWLADQDKLAAQLSAAAQAAGREPEAVTHPTVQGVAAVAYTDMNGWSSVTWAPRSDIVLSVTGLKIPTDQIVALAQGAVVQ